MSKQGNPKVNAIILMGVSGCGKTTIGLLLADRLGWEFVESDDYHSGEDVRKMSSGIPLTDKDRWPWLERLHKTLREHIQQDRPLVMACSALKESYRKVLSEGLQGIAFVFLNGDFTLIYERMAKRKGHYMKADMLRSQFNTLEEPHNALAVDISLPPQKIIEMILADMNID